MIDVACLSGEIDFEMSSMKRWTLHPVAATEAGRGAGTGELAAGVDSITSRAPFSPALLFSLSIAVLLSLALLPLGCEASLLSWLSSFGILDLGARHDDNSHTTPVKLLSWIGFRSHFRHGFPDRSRARRPAFMAPWLALGPSL